MSEKKLIKRMRQLMISWSALPEAVIEL